MRMRQLRGPLLFSFVLFLLFEGVARVLAGLGAIALEPGDIHGFDRIHRGDEVPVEDRLYRTDRDLIFRLRPGFRTVYDRASLYPGRPTTYAVETNDRGYRTQRFSQKKAPGVFRIVCLGDSSTFGMNVEAADAYPGVLSELLEAIEPGRFEVLNLGVPGYTSRQGLELIRREVAAYEPDLVTFGFGSNGRFWPGAMTDDATMRFNQSRLGGLTLAAKDGLDHLYSYRLLRRAVTSVLYSIVDRGVLARRGPRRVTLDGLRDAIVAAHEELDRRGAVLMVLDNDLAKTDAREGIRSGVAASGAPHLDMRGLFDDERRERTRQIAAEHRLPPPKARDGAFLVRVRAPGRAVVTLEWRPFLGEGSTDPMRDDGRQGDQVAGDGIWSLYARWTPGQRVLYAYWAGTEGEDVREFHPGTPIGGSWRVDLVPDAAIGDIDEFGHYYLHTDNAHPDEQGHRLIAETLLPAVLEIEAGSP